MKTSMRLSALIAALFISSCGGGGDKAQQIPVTWMGYDAAGSAWQAQVNLSKNSLQMNKLDLINGQVIDSQNYTLKPTAVSSLVYEINELPGFLFGANAKTQSAMAAAYAEKLPATNVVPVSLNATVLNSIPEMVGTYVYVLPSSTTVPGNGATPDVVITSPGYNFVIDANETVKYVCLPQNSSDQADCDSVTVEPSAIVPLSTPGWWALSFKLTDKGVNPPITAQLKLMAMVTVNNGTRHLHFISLPDPGCVAANSCRSISTFSAVEIAASPAAYSWNGKWLFNREGSGGGVFSVKQQPKLNFTAEYGKNAVSATGDPIPSVQFGSVYRLDQTSLSLTAYSYFTHYGSWIYEYSEYGTSAVFTEPPAQLNRVSGRFAANGTTGPFTLDVATQNCSPNSFTVDLITLDKATNAVLQTTRLSRFIDYTEDLFSLRLLFRAPVPSFDSAQNPNFIEYACNPPPENSSPRSLGIKLD